MVGDGRKSSRFGIMPDLMTTCCMTKKLKAKSLEFFDNLPIFKPG
jgi:hypothetical protein